TPLTLILAPLESLLRRSNPREVGTVLEVIHKNAVRLLGMITSLLDVSKVESGGFKVFREPIEIGSLTRGILRDFEPLLQKKRLQLHEDYRPEELPVLMDRYLYERILFNLLSNAVKFTPEGGKIGVFLEFYQGRVLIKVKDTGIGISENSLE